MHSFLFLTSDKFGQTYGNPRQSRENVNGNNPDLHNINIACHVHIIENADSLFTG